MNIAFYAPLKPPDSLRPSGDRRMARLLIAALEGQGHSVGLACRLRTRDGDGDPDRQARLSRIGSRAAAGLVNRWSRGPAAKRPDAWVTYHLYYKAPDHLGPAVSAALGIPYVVIEASHAPKRANGPWAASHVAVKRALGQADLVVGLNSRDRGCVSPVMGPSARYLQLRPFLDLAPYAGGSGAPAVPVADPIAAMGLGEERVRLLAVGMMRSGDKLDSYHALARSLKELEHQGNWCLMIVGDGPERATVETMFSRFGDRVRFGGEVDAATLAAYYAHADVLVWPAVREAYGMALMEAQASGLPVVAGDVGGVPDIVRNGRTGLLTPDGDTNAFADAVSRLLVDADLRTRLGQAAMETAVAEHGMDTAGARLGDAVAGLVRERVR